MLLGRIKEVKSVLDFLDTDRVLVGVVLEDELLEIQERPLVVDLLADLDERTPRVLGGETSALGTLSSLNEVLDFEDLLEDGGGEHLRRRARARVSLRWPYTTGLFFPATRCTRRLASFWMVSLTLNRLLCGSVQINPASINRTLLRPFSFLRQMASSSLDSMSQMTHCVGGERYREHPLHQLMAACFGIPSVISILTPQELAGWEHRVCAGTHALRRQLTQRLAPFGSMGVPQSVERLHELGERVSFPRWRLTGAEDERRLCGRPDVSYSS